MVQSIMEIQKGKIESVKIIKGDTFETELHVKIISKSNITNGDVYQTLTFPVKNKNSVRRKLQKYFNLTKLKETKGMDVVIKVEDQWTRGFAIEKNNEQLWFSLD